MVSWWWKLCIWCSIMWLHLSDEYLTHLILSSVPQQVPFGFQINPIPREIVSWLTNLLQNQPEKEQWSKLQTRNKLSLGLASPPISNPLEYSIHTLPHSPKIINTEFSVPSDKSSVRADFILNNTTLVNLNQLEPPWIMWHRPTDWPTAPTPDWTSMANLHSFYNDNWKDIKTQIHLKNNKSPLQRRYYENFTNYHYLQSTKHNVNYSLVHFSLLWGPMSTSRFQVPEKPKSSAYETSDSSKVKDY